MTSYSATPEMVSGFNVKMSLTIIVTVTKGGDTHDHSFVNEFTLGVVDGKPCQTALLTNTVDQGYNAATKTITLP